MAQKTKVYSEQKTVKVIALKDPKGVQSMTEGETYEVSEENAEALIKAKRAKKA